MRTLHFVFAALTCVLSCVSIVLIGFLFWSVGVFAWLQIAAFLDSGDNLEQYNQELRSQIRVTADLIAYMAIALPLTAIVIVFFLRTSGQDKGASGCKPIASPDELQGQDGP